MLLCPVPQKFNTFNTFNTFAVVTPALEHPTLIHPQSPRLHATPPLLSPTGRVPTQWVARWGGIQNRQRVAPYGSTVATPKTVWKVKR
jgi:hypothetical protein